MPVVLTSVEGSIQLAESMEARAFGGGPRTSLGRTPLNHDDWLVIVGSGAAVVGFAASAAAGRVADWFPYPSLSAPAIDLAPLVACLLLFIPVVIWRRRA